MQEQKETIFEVVTIFEVKNEQKNVYITKTTNALQIWKKNPKSKTHSLAILTKSAEKAEDLEFIVKQNNYHLEGYKEHNGEIYGIVDTN